MKISDKLYKKYGTNAVILPPPAEGLEDFEIRPEKPSKGIIDMGLEWVPGFQGGEGHELSGLSDEETLEFLKQQSDENLPEEIVNQPSEDAHFRALPKDEATIPPPKKASKTDVILKKCSQYHDLCCKLQTYDS